MAFICMCNLLNSVIWDNLKIPTCYYYYYYYFYYYGMNIAGSRKCDFKKSWK